MSKPLDKIKSRIKSVDPIPAIYAVGAAAVVVVTLKFTATNSAAYTAYLIEQNRILANQADKLFDLAVDTATKK